MANLAIKGHATRGREVIELLEMLGGKNNQELHGDRKDLYYFINSDCYGTIDLSSVLGLHCAIFTLEEFLEKFPYKVGDKVFAFGNKCTIIDAVWDGSIEEVVYTIKSDTSEYTTTKLSNQLQPYKEETMEEIRIDIPNRYEFFGINDDNQIVLTKKQIQYPKTIEECAKVLSTLPHTRNGVNGYNSHALWKLQQLLICRDAYWKIAGEQMGLDEPWKPDYGNDCDTKYIITVARNEIYKDVSVIFNYFLIFPTEEMRDVFFENFKDLIEECKEFL